MGLIHSQYEAQGGRVCFWGWKGLLLGVPVSTLCTVWWLPMDLTGTPLKRLAAGGGTMAFMFESSFSMAVTECVRPVQNWTWLLQVLAGSSKALWPLLNQGKMMEIPTHHQWCVREVTCCLNSSICCITCSCTFYYIKHYDRQRQCLNVYNHVYYPSIAIIFCVRKSFWQGPILIKIWWLASYYNQLTIVQKWSCSFINFLQNELPTQERRLSK